MQKLNAVTLRNVLWETLNDVRENKMDPARADAIAAQSREILRSAKIQLTILSQANIPVTTDLIVFADGKVMVEQNTVQNN
jgi:hypothetical protein